MVDTTLHGAREAFLVSGRIDTVVRPLVARSWQRSVQAGAALAPPRPCGLPDPEGAMVRAAAPVAERLLEQLGDVPLAVLLTDRRAQVLARWTHDRRLAGAVDDGFGLPGVSFEEQSLGTNALGTVIEEEGPVIVSGPEHLSEQLQQWTCVAAPVRHPVTRRIEGVIDLSCLIKDGSPLMLPLVTRLAEEIGERLGAGRSRRDRVLLDAFLRVSRRGPARPMFAVNGATMIANSPASLVLAGHDLISVWQWAQELLEAGVEQHGPLEDQWLARAEGVHVAGGLAGAIVTLRQAAVTQAPAPRRQAGRSPLHPWFRGEGSATESLLQRTMEAAGPSTPLLLCGEAGTGKRRLAEALHRVRRPAHPYAEHDAAGFVLDAAPTWLPALREDLAASGTTVVVRRLDQLGERELRLLAHTVEEFRRREGLTIATLSEQGRPGAGPPGLLDSTFGAPIRIPPLRQRPEAIPEIAAHLLERGDAAEPAVLGEDALRRIRSYDWPGNVSELERVLGAAARASPGRLIRPAALPDLTPMVPSRALTTLERVELEAILDALRDARGNKQLAAERLGIARSTLYRKLNALTPR